MTIWLLSYTARGRALAARVADIMKNEGHGCRTFALPKFCGAGDEPLTRSAADWAGLGFEEADALVFCCASGIAVRAIAPHVRDKRRDPGVLVLDEGGTFVIPLLSGHLGGANALAVDLADKLSATPVLTTATDVNGLFAVDVFAKENGLFIEDVALCKAVSAALLAGEQVGFRADLPVAVPLPKGLTAEAADLGIYVSAANDRPFPRTLRLIPRRYTAGLGCRRGKSAEELESFLIVGGGAEGRPRGLYPIGLRAGGHGRGLRVRAGGGAVLRRRAGGPKNRRERHDLRPGEEGGGDPI